MPAMKMLIVFCLLLIGPVCQGQGEVEVTLSVQGLNFAAGIAVNVLARDLNRKIPDISTNGVDITNIRITEFLKPSSAVTLNPGDGISLSLVRASIRAEANWSYLKKILFIKIRDRGTVTASSSASITVSVKVGINGNKPTISATGCSCSLTDLRIKIGGSWASFLYNLFISLFKGSIKSRIESSICAAATRAINTNGAQQLNSLNLRARINNFLTIDYSLAKAPLFTSTFMKSYHRGKFVDDAVIDVTPIMTTPTNKMIAFSISENVLNSGLRVLFNKNVIRYVYNFNSWGDIAGSLPFNTSYGNGPFSVQIYASTTPTARISIGSLTVNISCAVDIISRTPGQAPTTVQSLRFILTATAEASLELSVLRGNVTRIVPQVISITPPIPNVSTSQINLSILQLVNLALPSINEKLSKGIPLPTVYGVTFIQTNLAFNDRFLTSSANVRYIP